MPTSDFDRVAGALAVHLDKVLCQQMQRQLVSESWVKASSKSLMAAGLAAISLTPPTHVETNGYSPISDLLVALLTRRDDRTTLTRKFRDVVDWINGESDDRSDLVEKLVCVCDEHDTDSTIRMMTEHVCRCISACSTLDVGGHDRKCSVSEGDCSDEENDDRSSSDDVSHTETDSDTEGDEVDEEDAEDEEDEEDGGGAEAGEEDDDDARRQTKDVNPCIKRSIAVVYNTDSEIGRKSKQRMESIERNHRVD